MNQYINFSRSMKQIETKGGATVPLPEFCSKRISYYRFDPEGGILEIRCRTCEKFFPVMELQGSGEEYSWKDVHKESDFHFMSQKSGYDGECILCKNAVKQLEHKEKAAGSSGRIKTDKESYTVFLTQENKRYLQLYKIVHGVEITEVVNELIEDLRRRRPLKVVSEE